ncbi:hypothetical protein F0562_003224 [Nyssa sinensis]|uniref:non-specific serine/threonine protein kinase n=1 Tax=Nyssa sinensis TaxID=561372 RepID=A0A5J5BUS7_9ASTE|nr:hypothetical protein F0562_003224 [Nyssa sinensis]
MMSSRMELVFAVLILTCLQSFVLPDAQGDALYALKVSLNASTNQLTDWNQYQVNPCTWSKVTCDTSNNVISVSLPSMGFNGSLSPKIGVLRTLSTLYVEIGAVNIIFELHYSKLWVQLIHPKPFVSNFCNEVMLLGMPKISYPCSMMHSSCSSLQGNGITGEIPEVFGNLTSLTMLNLENNRLTGGIPSSLGNLKKLQFLILDQNNLTGAIPESLSSLPSLINLQLASNGLSGQIPESLFQVSKYDFSGNHLSCGMNYAQPCASVSGGASHKPKIGMVVGIVAGVLGLLLIGGLVLFFWKGRHKGYRREIFVDVAGEVDRRIAFGQLKRFAWRELQVATDSFSEKNVLGQGGFGKVYKGVLSDNTKVAVKRLTDYESPGGDAAFQREVEMISVAVHRNLLRLIGFCTTPTERLLVYPFMQNLSVAYRLRELKPGEPVLDWPTRKRVALGTARGLEYLHEHCNPKIIHRDVKAANVLLDEFFEAVVGDFGLAKLVDVRKTNVTTQVRGTMGHIAPEYLSTGKSSERTDVFGYGIMLLELVTGQRAIDFSRLEEEDDVLLLDHVKKLEREKRLDAIVDRNLNRNYNIQEVEMMMQVALLCTQAVTG